MNDITMHKRLTITRGLASLLLFLWLISSTAFAQVHGVDKGDRVRITAPNVQTGKIKGTVDSFSSSMLTLSSRDTTLSIPFESIRTLEVSTGEKRNIGRGALIGATSGAVALGILLAATNKPCEDGDWCFFEMTDAEAFGFGALAGSLGGAVNGAIIGTFVKTDRWKKVPVRISVAVSPSTGNNRVVGPKVVVRF